jgi:hypothetical protein
MPPLTTTPDGTSRWTTGATTGIALLDVGPVVVPPVAQARAEASYRAAYGIQLGARIDLTRVPFDDVSHGTMWLGGPQLAIGDSLRLTPRLSLVGGASAGMRFAWGLKMGNPFVDRGHASDTIPLFLIEVEAGIAWRASSRLALRVLPLAFQYSPRRAPMAADIGALRAIAALIGVDVLL